VVPEQGRGAGPPRGGAGAGARRPPAVVPEQGCGARPRWCRSRPTRAPPRGDAPTPEVEEEEGGVWRRSSSRHAELVPLLPAAGHASIYFALSPRPRRPAQRSESRQGAWAPADWAAAASGFTAATRLEDSAGDDEARRDLLPRGLRRRRRGEARRRGRKSSGLLVSAVGTARAEPVGARAPRFPVSTRVLLI
jgi:hypothetical protein